MIVVIFLIPASGSAALLDSPLQKQSAQVIDVGEIFKGITMPFNNFLENLSMIGKDIADAAPSAGGARNWSIFGFFDELDRRFEEITGISIIQFIKAIVGLIIWFLQLFVKLFEWILSLIK